MGYRTPGRRRSPRGSRPDMRDTSVEESRQERFAVRARRGNRMAHRPTVHVSRKGRSMLRPYIRVQVPMLLVRITAGLAIGYAFLVVLAWLFQERLAFPAPRAPVPDPKGLGISNG